MASLRRLIARVLVASFVLESVFIPSVTPVNSATLPIPAPQAVELHASDSTAGPAVPAVVTGPLWDPDDPPAPPPTPAAPKMVSLPVTMTLSIQPAAAMEGDPLTYTFRLLNSGPDPIAAGLQLRAVLPQAVHWELGQPGVYTATTRVVTVTLPAIPPRLLLAHVARVRLAGIPAGGVLSQTVTLIQPGAGTVTTATAEVSVANPGAMATAGPEGGTLVSPDARVRVDFPPGALTTTTRLEQSWSWVGDMWPGQRGQFLRFSLDAFDAASGQPIHSFAATATLTLRVGDLVPAGRSFRLRHWVEETGQWVDMAGLLTPDPVTGLVQVPLAHFSEFDAPNNDPNAEGWKLLFNDANVGLFNGSLSYVFPVEVVPGRHGLQPDVALTYSSGRANGVTRWIQSDWAGLGWSADTMEITRGLAKGAQPKVPGQSEGYDTYCAMTDEVCLNDVFTLLFHGYMRNRQAST